MAGDYSECAAAMNLSLSVASPRRARLAPVLGTVELHIDESWLLV
jgi:hypothetical protein